MGQGLSRTSFAQEMINKQFDDGARICENCGTRMEDVKCKLVCPKCKCFRSCSDLF